MPLNVDTGFTECLRKRRISFNGKRLCEKRMERFCNSARSAPLAFEHLLNRKNLLESLLQTVSEASNFDKYIIEFVVATP